MPDMLVFLPEARQDIADAYSWYEEQAFGLGVDFLRCVEAAILLIERQPRIYPIVHANYRRALVRRFPYSVFYEQDAGQIVIYIPYSIAHKTRKSGIADCPSGCNTIGMTE